MADDNEEQNDNQGDAKEGSGGKKIILLAIIGLLLVGISVGGTLAALSFLGDDEEAVVAEGETGEGEAAEEPTKQAIYYDIKPPIMTSFDARGRQRLVQAEITLLTRDDDVVPAVELHMPMIRNSLVLLISGQVYEELQTAEGKELLRVQSLQELQALMEKEIGKPGIEEVLFTNLILQ